LMQERRKNMERMEEAVPFPIATTNRSSTFSPIPSGMLAPCWISGD
jgi:hypothetical protein